MQGGGAQLTPIAQSSDFFSLMKKRPFLTWAIGQDTAPVPRKPPFPLRVPHKALTQL